MNISDAGINPALQTCSEAPIEIVMFVSPFFLLLKRLRTPIGPSEHAPKLTKFCTHVKTGVKM